MEHPQPYADDALRQRVRHLIEQLQHVYASWQEAYHQQDVGRQLALLEREHAILIQLQGIIAALRQALQARQASDGQPPERTP